MRKFTLIIVGTFILLNTAIAASAQSAASITAIQGKVATINKGLKRFRKVKKDVSGISTEGAEATYYHDRRALKKIYAKIYGETFSAVTSLYFDNGQPLYYELKHNRYDTQIGLEKPVKVVKVEIEKHYFTSGKLVRITAGNKTIKRQSDRFTELNEGMTKIAADLKAAYSSENSSSND